jgi:hypothetical protein
MNAWGCDRCQVTYPAQPVAPPQAMQPAPAQMQAPMQPPQMQGYGAQPGYAAQPAYGAQPGYAPQPGHAPRTGAPAAKKKILLFAGIGVAAVALIVILVVVLGGGGGGGKADPKDLYEAAATLATKGDVDGLVPLMVESQAMSAADCSGAKGAGGYGTAEMEKMMLDELRHELKREVKKWDGLTVTVESVEAKGDPKVQKAGEDEGGCKLKSDVTSQKFKVKVKAKGKDGEAESETTMRGVQISGKWYLEELPDAPDANDDLAKMKKFKDQMCACGSDKDPSGCADKADKDYEEWTRSMADKYKDKKPEDIPQELIKTAQDYADCEMKAKMAGMGGSGN